MKYVVIFLIALLVGGGGAVAFFFASPETHQAARDLPWWAGPLTGLALAPVLAGVFLWWHRKPAQEKPQTPNR